MFPPAGKGYGWCIISGPYKGDAQIYNLNGMVLLLPYFEQTALYQHLDLTQAMSWQNTGYCCGYVGDTSGGVVGNPAVNAQWMATPIAILRCPSDAGVLLQGPSAPYGPDGPIWLKNPSPPPIPPVLMVGPVTRCAGKVGRAGGHPLP